MSFFLQNSETIPEGIRRICTEQMDEILRWTEIHKDDQSSAVHEIRKSFKKLRAVLRLVRYEIGDKMYKTENIAFRDAGRLLSGLRDCDVHLETLDEIIELLERDIDRNLILNFRNMIEVDKFNLNHKLLSGNNVFKEIAQITLESKNKIKDWDLQRNTSTVFFYGLKQIYSKAFKEMLNVLHDSSDEALHEWRKQIKYLWYHTRLFNSLGEEEIEKYSDLLDELSDILGKDHDYAELKKRMVNAELDDEMAENLTTAVIKIEKLRNGLQSQAMKMGKELFTRKPSEFAEMICNRWERSK